MSGRRSWPAPGWVWSAELETYVPESSPLARLDADRLRELEELEARLEARGADPAPAPPRVHP